MKRETYTGSVNFRCPTCQNLVPGNEYDVAYLQSSRTDTTIGGYNNLIKNTPNDPAGLKIKKDCDKCGLDFMSMLRLGASEKIVYRCGCKNTIYN